ncbi:hypothetical protein ACWGBX_16465 [Streptomyces sp. NPDC055037]|uniref:hypothetical protein n=1 Tax=Streptomyces sp. NPDC059569 TaxID=3346869 RepID=UPI0036810729
MPTYVGGWAPHGLEELEPEPDSEDFRDLFLGEYDETAEQREVRRAAARDVLVELLEQSESDEIALLNAVYAAQLSGVAALRNIAGVPLVTWTRAAA